MGVVEVLKPHNLEAYQEINGLLGSGIKKIAIPRATGSGKTYIMGALAEQFNDDKKLVLEPTRPLLNSIKEKFDEFDIANTDFITYQKLIRMSDEDIAAMDYKLIFLDEFHHGTAPVWGQKIDCLMKTHTDSIIFGTSATTVRNDGVNVVETLFNNNTINELSLSAAIAKKVLPCPHYITAIYRIDDEFEKLKKRIEDSTNTKDEKKEFYHKMQEMKVHFEKSYGIPLILNKYIKMKDGRYLVFCKNKKHLKAMCDVVINWFQTAGIKEIHSYAVYSDYPEKEKDYKDFCEDNSDSAKILFSINMLNEGLHIKDISGVLMLRTTRSNLVYLQQLGRLLEAGNMDKYLLVFDFVNNFSSANDGVGLLREIKDAIAREKEGDPDFDDSGFEDIDTYFVLDQILEVQEMFREIEGRLGGRLWAEEEIEILKKWYPIEGGNVEKRLNGRTRGTINTIAYRLGIKAPDKSWTEDEIDILKRYYPVEGKRVKSRLEGRTKEMIQSMASRLGIKMYSTWMPEEIYALKKYYPKYGTNISEFIPNKSKEMIENKANELKIVIEKRGIFTDEEDELIKEYYPKEGGNVYKRLDNKTKNQCISRAKYLGILSVNTKVEWTDEEDDILRQYYPVEKTTVYKRLNGRSKHSCVHRAKLLNISSKGNAPWSDKEYEILKKYYPTIGSEVALILGKTKRACNTKAHKLGIKKEREKKYKYVYKERKKYVVQFYVNGKNMRFGRFDSEEEAGRVALEKAKEYGKLI